MFTMKREHMNPPVAGPPTLREAETQLATLQKAAVQTNETINALEGAQSDEEKAAGDALAAAVVAGLPAPSTPALDEIEAQLKRAKLQRDGLERQLRDAERTWAQAQGQSLREQAAVKADEQTALQRELDDITAEVQRLQRKGFELGSRIQVLGVERNDLQAQADALAVKYPG